MLCHEHSGNSYKGAPCAHRGGLTEQVLSNELVNFLEIGAADGFRNKNYIEVTGTLGGNIFLTFSHIPACLSVFL